MPEVTPATSSSLSSLPALLLSELSNFRSPGSKGATGARLNNGSHCPPRQVGKRGKACRDPTRSKSLDHGGKGEPDSSDLLLRLEVGKTDAELVTLGWRDGGRLGGESSRETPRKTLSLSLSLSLSHTHTHTHTQPDSEIRPEEQSRFCPHYPEGVRCNR